eukprot:scaffold120310_cov63-Phaeocystis_antarctica.AAC.3
MKIAAYGSSSGTAGQKASVEVCVLRVQPVHLHLRRGAGRKHVARDELVRPHQVDDAQYDSEVAEERVHQHEGPRVVPVLDAVGMDAPRIEVIPQARLLAALRAAYPSQARGQLLGRRR